MGVKVFGNLFSCSGCSAATGTKVGVPWTTGCCSIRPLERVFVDLSGKRPTSAGGAQYLMMIVDDYSRMECPYLQTRKSNIPAALQRFLTEVNATGVPSTVACVRSDNGPECVRAEFVELLDRRGIRYEANIYRCAHRSTTAWSSGI